MIKLIFFCLGRNYVDKSSLPLKLIELFPFWDTIKVANLTTENKQYL